MRRAAFTAILALSASGCAYYPDLYSIDTASFSGNSRLEIAMRKATELQSQYETNYKEVGKIRDVLQLPIIIAAGATGLVLVDGGIFSEGNQTTRAGEIGVMATTFAAGSGALTSPEMANFYIKGHGALSCAISFGMRFADAPNAPTHRKFLVAVTYQRNVIGALDRTFSFVPNDAGDEASKKLLASARTLARSTLVSSRLARNGALEELGAFEGAATAFELEASEISVLVASKGQVRSAVEYSALTDSFSIPAADQDEGGGGAAFLKSGARSDGAQAFIEAAADMNSIDTQRALRGDLSHAEITSLTSTLVELLLSATSDLQGFNPGYKASLTKMESCSSIVTSS